MANSYVISTSPDGSVTLSEPKELSNDEVTVILAKVAKRREISALMDRISADALRPDADLDHMIDCLKGLVIK